MNTRIETDTMGEVAVPTEAYWGAQTQRSRDNFKIGGETLPAPLIRAMALVKKAAAQTNAALGRLDEARKNLIVQAAAEENPMGRNATPADVVPAMAFLLSDEARFITGVTLPVTGGSAIV